MSIAQYRFRKLSPEEFSAALDAAGLSAQDFMYLTGRHRFSVENYLQGSETGWKPTMADVLIIELAKHFGPAGVKLMFKLVHPYGDGRERKYERS